MMIGNIIIDWEYYWWTVQHKSWLTKSERRERHKKLLTKQQEKIQEKKRIKRETIQYITEKKQATILTAHSKERIGERIKLKEETIKSNVFKSLINKKCVLQYCKTLNNYRLFSWIATYILSEELVLITTLQPLKYKEKKSFIYRTITKQERAKILEKMWFNLDYHPNWKARLD